MMRRNISSLMLRKAKIRAPIRPAGRYLSQVQSALCGKIVPCKHHGKRKICIAAMNADQPTLFIF